MTISSSERVRIADSVLVQQVRGELLFLNMNNETYFGLDEVGSRMFQVLNSSESIQSAYAALLEEYEVDPHQLESDLNDLVNRLLENGLIQRDAK